MLELAGLLCNFYTFMGKTKIITSKIITGVIKVLSSK